MTWNLQTAREWLEIADPLDTSNDAAIIAAQSIALGMAEDYCGRNFFEAQRTEYISCSDASGRFFLKNNPIKTIDSILGPDGIPITKYKVRKGLGMLILDIPIKADEEIEVTYTAGWLVLPPVVEHALWGMFDVLYSEDDADATDDVSSITLPDVGTITYNQQSKPATVKAAFGYFLAMLDPYKVNHGF